jgi:hypothetical protein
MINCQSCQELLPELSMGELEARDQKKVKYHLSNCRACAVQLAKYQRVWSSLPLALDPITPPDTIRVQLMDRVKTKPRTGRNNLPDRSSAGRKRSDHSRLLRYFVAASVLFGLFTLSKMYWSGDDTDGYYANQPEVRQQIYELASSLGRGSQIVNPSNGVPNFVHVKMKNGAAYGSAAQTPDASLVWDRVTDKWHLFASNLDKKSPGSEGYKMWLADRNGKWTSTNGFLAIRNSGYSRASLSSVSKGFHSAMITLETDEDAATPSASVLFEASLRTSVTNVAELEF